MPRLPKLLIPVLLLGTARSLAAQSPTVQTPAAQAPTAPAPAVSAPSDTTPTTATPYDPHATLAAAFQRLDDADKDVSRFTYFLDLAMGEVSRSGRTHDVTTLRYEATYINGLLYMRMVEQNGAPLTGSALKDEQKRYEKALAKKKDLGAQKRASSDDYSIEKLDFDPEAVLTPAYTLSVIAAGRLKGELAHVIDAVPVPGVKHKSHCSWSLRFWLDDKSGNLLRYTADTGKDTTPQCANEGLEAQYTSIDGIPKMAMQAALTNVPDDHGNYYAAKSRATYTNYRRFGTSITIKTGDVIPPDEPAAPATPADPSPPAKP